MNPPYDLTPSILRLVSRISEQLGEAKALYLDKPSPRLRKQNQIRTIHSSLRIEGNTLSIDQITALIENKRVIGPKQDIIEVRNAIKVYNHIDKFEPTSAQSFLQAHEMLMQELIEKPGQYRTENVGIVQGDKVAHLAPPASNVDYLMGELFTYLKDSDELPLIKSCVFHYETEFIHPFIDGNGRMGRLWQSVILMNHYPIFQFIPFETLISNSQQVYYEVLGQSDKQGKSTVFIEYMLSIIDQSLTELVSLNNRSLKREDRLTYFCALNILEFSRQDYMNIFKNLSPATASRDLQAGVAQKIFEKNGDKRTTRYRLIT